MGEGSGDDLLELLAGFDLGEQERGADDETERERRPEPTDRGAAHAGGKRFGSMGGANAATNEQKATRHLRCLANVPLVTGGELCDPLLAACFDGAFYFLEMR